MILTAIQEMLTMTLWNKTANYMFKTPQNGPWIIDEILGSEQTKLAVYILSDSFIHNSDIKIVIDNSALESSSLLCSTPLGTMFAQTELRVDCSLCKASCFALIQQTPILGLFNCIIVIPKMWFMKTPKMAAITKCEFDVILFLIENDLPNYCQHHHEKQKHSGHILLWCHR